MPLGMFRRLLLALAFVSIARPGPAMAADALPEWDVRCDDSGCCLAPGGPTTAQRVAIRTPQGTALALGEATGFTLTSAGGDRWELSASQPIEADRVAINITVTEPNRSPRGLRLCSGAEPVVVQPGDPMILPLDGARTRTLANPTSDDGEHITRASIDPPLAAVDTIVNELLTQLTRIALDRAHRSALRSVTALIRRAACEAQVTRSDGKRVPAAEILVETCALVRYVRTADLLNLRYSLVRALHRDGSRQLWGDVHEALPDRISEPLGLLVGDALSLLAEGLTDRRPGVSYERAHRIVSRFATIDWSTMIDDAEPACVLDVTRRVLLACSESVSKEARCHVAAAARVAIQQTSRCTDVRPPWRLRIRASDAAEPAWDMIRKGATPRERADALRRFVIAVLTAAAGHPSDGSAIAADISALDRFLAAAIQQDGARMVATFAECLADKYGSGTRHAARLARLSAGVVSYIETYSAPRDPDLDDEARLQADRQARRAVLEALIDDLASRDGRAGQWIGSLGIGVGANLVGGAYHRATESGQFYVTQLSLPTGIALQYTPPAEGGVGFHSQLTLLDLGQYAAFDQGGDVTAPDYHTAAVIGGQIGLLAGDPATPFVVTADIRYAPGLFGDGVLRAGLFIGVYAPLLDLN